MTSFLSFALVAGLLTLVPGLDTALVLRAAIIRGRAYGFLTALGIGTGTLVWGGTAAAGLTVLLTASQIAYTALRIAGAIYLVWYGCATLVGLWRTRTEDDHAVPPETPTRGGLTRAWARGALTNLLNPKVGVFYVAMLPQFIPAGAPHLAMGLGLALMHDLEGMLWFTLLISGAHLARRWLGRRSVRRAMEAVTGSVLLAFGVGLAVGE
jgi:threonine/homoserine/homoserine lactone efflux protein